MDRMFESDAPKTVDVVKASPDIHAAMNKPHFESNVIGHNARITRCERTTSNSGDG